MKLVAYSNSAITWVKHFFAYEFKIALIDKELLLLSIDRRNKYVYNCSR